MTIIRQVDASMKLLVIGSGGREHAAGDGNWQSPASQKSWSRRAAPAPATGPKCRNVAVKATDIDGLLRLAQDKGVALTVVGPRQPLVAGVVDAFAQGRQAGPTAAAARGWKAARPTPGLPATTASPCGSRRAHRRRRRAPTSATGAPIVVRPMAGRGQGVIVAMAWGAGDAVRVCSPGNAFGDASARGDRGSLDGGSQLHLDGRRPHRAADGHQPEPQARGRWRRNLFTGGMGAYSPACGDARSTRASCARW